MANYFAHLVFGRQVLQALPAPTRRLILQERDAFVLGLYGPDPLFFYHPITNKGGVRSLGHRVHAAPLRPMARRLRQCVEAGLPMSRGYSAGLLCHFALDCTCHRYIHAHTGPLTHAGMESELDRSLLLRHGHDPLRDTPFLTPPLSMAQYGDLVEAAYPTLGPRQYRDSLSAYLRASLFQTLVAGTPWRHIVNAASRLPPLEFFRSSVLRPRPDPLYKKAVEDLLTAMEGQVAPAAAAIVNFFRPAFPALADPWYDRDFSGVSHALPRPASA